LPWYAGNHLFEFFGGRHGKAVSMFSKKGLITAPQETAKAV
jgi:hypothetical protein